MHGTVRSFHLLINKKAGSVLKAGEDNLQALIAESGVPVKSLQLIEPQHFSDQLHSLAQDETPILIGGGDGTIASCLPHFIEQKKTMGVLPLGTMNLLAKDLGFSGDLAEALTQYTKLLSTANIDVGYVNDHPFLCCAGLGTMPESAVFRENMRGTSDIVMYPRLIKFIFDQMDPARHRRLTLQLDGRRKYITSAALVVSNNLFANHQDTSEGFLERPSLSGGRLGVYSFAPRSLKDKLTMLFRLRLGGWKDNVHLREWHARTLVVDDPEHKELVSVDGEVIEMMMPLRFRIEPRQLSVMMPSKGS